MKTLGNIVFLALLILHKKVLEEVSSPFRGNQFNPRSRPR